MPPDPAVLYRFADGPRDEITPATAQMLTGTGGGLTPSFPVGLDHATLGEFAYDDLTIAPGPTPHPNPARPRTGVLHRDDLGTDASGNPVDVDPPPSRPAQSSWCCPTARASSPVDIDRNVDRRHSCQEICGGRLVSERPGHLS